MTFLDHLTDGSAWLWPRLADHLWQATLFAAFALAAAVLLAHGPARARYLVWLLAAAKFALPSYALVVLAGGIGFDRPTIDSLGPWPGAPAISRVMTPWPVPGPQPLPTPVGATAVGQGRARYNALTLVWAAGAAIVAARWSLRWRRFSKALKAGRMLTAGREAEALERARARAGWTGRIALLASPEIEQPGVCGVLRPVIVFPEGMADPLTDAELESVFLHELVHVRRRDNLASHLHMALCCLLWFWPVVWLIDRRLLVERERVCDDEVLGMAGAPSVYASSLLKVCRFCLESRVAGVSAAAGSSLRSRVERIISREAQSKPTAVHRALLGATAVLLGLFIVVGCFSATASVPPQPAPPSPAETPRARGSSTPPAALMQAWIDRAPSIAVAFENPAGAAVLVRSATAKIVPLVARPFRGERHPGAAAGERGQVAALPPGGRKRRRHGPRPAAHGPQSFSRAVFEGRRLGVAQRLLDLGQAVAGLHGGDCLVAPRARRARPSRAVEAQMTPR